LLTSGKEGVKDIYETVRMLESRTNPAKKVVEKLLKYFTVRLSTIRNHLKVFVVLYQSTTSGSHGRD